jgi:DNA-binding CsgD family transcriptional regulator
MILTAAGRSQAEIAEHLRVTPKTVERMLANERVRQRNRRAG